MPTVRLHTSSQKNIYLILLADSSFFVELNSLNSCRFVPRITPGQAWTTPGPAPLCLLLTPAQCWPLSVRRAISSRVSHRGLASDNFHAVRCPRLSSIEVPTRTDTASPLGCHCWHQHQHQQQCCAHSAHATRLSSCDPGRSRSTSLARTDQGRPAARQSG